MACAQTGVVGDPMELVGLIDFLCYHVCQVADPGLNSTLKVFLLGSLARKAKGKHARISFSGRPYAPDFRKHDKLAVSEAPGLDYLACLGAMAVPEARKDGPSGVHKRPPKTASEHTKQTFTDLA